MDLSMDMDMDMTPQPSGNVALTHYLGRAATVGTSGGAGLSWQEADQQHFHKNNPGLFDTSTLVPWSEEEANQYVVSNHPMVMEDHELDLALSDHSNTTPSDSDSRGSSNSYSVGSLPSQELTLAPDADWQNFPVTYSPQGQVTLLPPLGLPPPASSVYSLMNEDHHHHSSFFMPHGADTLTPTVDPATFHESPMQEHYVARVRSRHPRSRPSSSSPLLSLNDHCCIAISELSPPYIPEGHPRSDIRVVSSSEELSAGSSSRIRSRDNSIRGRGSLRGGHGRSNLRTHSSRMGSPDGASGVKRALTSSSSSSGARDEAAPIAKRPRRSLPPKAKDTPANGEDYDEGESDADDSDVYTPSRSPSPDPSLSDYSGSGSPPPSRTSRRLSGIAKGKKPLRISAADALAQMSATSSTHASSPGIDQDGEWEPIDAYGAGPSRKNGTIPHPVPVPNLTKNSRGRKVPYVDHRAYRGLSRPDAAQNDGDDGNGMRGGSSRQGRARGVTRGRGGGRPFVCDVTGCGKCFIRGEHLKRHVRSIHTNDKPHPCPYPGCGKSFSRRDNLGQHVRLHLIGPSDV